MKDNRGFNDISKEIDNQISDDSSSDGVLGKFEEKVYNLKKQRLESKLNSLNKEPSIVKNDESEKTTVVVLEEVVTDRRVDEVERGEVTQFIVNDEVEDSQLVDDGRVEAVSDIRTVDKKAKIEKKQQLSEYEDSFEIDKSKEAVEEVISDKKAMKTQNKDTVGVQKRSNRTKYVGIIRRVDVSSLTEEEKDKRISELKVKILAGIDKKLELDMVELNRIREEKNRLVDSFSDDEDYEKWVERKKKIEELLEKVRGLIEEINVLYENIDFSNVSDLDKFDNQIIVNDIIEYRDILDSSSRLHELSEEYKMLDNFVVLYREIFLTETRTKEMSDSVDTKVSEIVVRDEHYKNLDSSLDVVDDITRDCNLLIDKQNEYLKVLFSRIDHISSELITEYRFRGVNELLTSTLLYMGVMVATLPTRRIPRVMATRAVATRRLLDNMRRQMQPEVTTRLQYEALDFEQEIFAHLDDIRLTINVIDATLEDIEKYKQEFREEYEGRVPNYEEVLGKLKEMELVVKETRQKALVVEKQLEDSQRVNESKLVRVKELNLQR